MGKYKQVTMLSSLVMVATLAGTEVSAAAATAKTINWTQNSALVTTDQSKLNDTASSQVVSQAGQGLYRLGKDSKAVKADAKTVKTSADGLTWTITLRDGLKWSNGEAVTAQDYVYGWQRTINAANASNYAALMYVVKGAKDLNTGVSSDYNSLGIKALDDKTLEISLVSPAPNLPSLMTTAGFYPQNEAFEKSVGAAYGTTADASLSNGPFILKDWNGTSKEYNLVKNPEYVDAKKVKTKKITFQTITDDTTGANLYKSGDVDFTVLSAAQTKANKNNKAYTLIKSGRTQYLDLNTTNKVLATTEARQAVQYAIDKQALVKSVLQGAGTVATTYTPAGVSTDPKSKKDFATAFTTSYVKYDSKKAKSLWAKALKATGEKSVTLTLLADNDASSAKQATYLQSQLEKNLKGLTVNVKTEPKAGRVSAMLSGNFDIVLSGWTGDYPDPVTFDDLYVTGTKMNVGKWSNAKYDAYINAAKTTNILDNDNRMADLGAAEKLLQKEAPVVSLYYVATPSLMRSSVSGVQVNKFGGQFDFTNAVKK